MPANSKVTDLAAKALNFINSLGRNSINSFVLYVNSSGPAVLGRLEYRMRSARSDLGEPLNGQSGRLDLCRQILAEFPPAAIVETGTFIGNTTKFFADFGVPVYTAEKKPRYHAFAEERFRSDRDRVHVVLGDSRALLRQLAEDPSFPKDDVFFYLDAHWYSDLPLAEEIEMIFGSWRRSVIMIDDFAVPGDSYSYDDYGPGAVLNDEYLDTLGRSDMLRFYPSLPAAQETGAKRGCVVLCGDPDTGLRLSKLPGLRTGTTPSGGLG
ncbi:uncharacterized protein RMCN_4723 [Mycolicibacterium novocastrense]|uniref:Methyltransferase n=1 Tax=Mycolicibacterium novocastrense TaxID=59813 RepID=A0ABQ0KQ32_MYCNV|nr:uncharacterized protein RMCN_4723 [Mycolicibacterium novocastrense]